MTGSTSINPMPSSDPDAATSASAQPHLPNERTEPNWDGRPPPHVADSAQEKLQPAYPAQDEWKPSRVTHVNRLMRLLLMAGIFVVGSAVGLGSAWWLNRSAPPSMGIRGIENSSSSSVSIQGNMRAGIRKGISPGELPYDGAVPASATGKARVPDAPAAKPEPVPVVPEEPIPTDDVAAEPEPPAPVAKETRTETKAPAVAQKHRTPARKTKDREIDRIRRQANEELKKKTEFGSGTARPRSKAGQVSHRETSKTARSDRAADKRILLASCERASNLFSRERCKWRVCGNSWGENGCPSYTQPASYY